MEVKGKGGISAKIIADSVSSVNGQRITTFELEYPRFILAELNTHRLFSRNTASSRAIPIKKVIQQVLDNPAKPVHWGKHQKGMQAEEEVQGVHKEAVGSLWEGASKIAANYASVMACHGLHKQVANRILEPFQMVKTLVTATSYDNFFWLRYHADAQPEIGELAKCMYTAFVQNAGKAQVLEPGEWHVPYVDYTKTLGYTLPVDGDYENGYESLTLEEALKVSASCAAQVSFRAADTSLEKALRIYDLLVESKPVHASPFESQATPMEVPDTKNFAGPSMKKVFGQEGVTHVDKSGTAWSGNYQGWAQHRQMIPESTCWDFEKGD